MGPLRYPLGSQPYMNYLLRERYKLNISEFPAVNVIVDRYMDGSFSTKKQREDTFEIFQFNRSESEREKVRKCLHIDM